MPMTSQRQKKKRKAPETFPIIGHCTGHWSIHLTDLRVKKRGLRIRGNRAKKGAEQERRINLSDRGVGMRINILLSAILIQEAQKRPPF